ncbi:transcriptional regulator [Nodosilinea sp. LEGE 06152]|uniref:helix-turn-helix domain-containing transcriptional regulator n=1 Tax=Nodosilinea sp. LEGE 06152 TaxID=2777966 RepID=UPI00187E7D62|nr:transcriptional regulator [Nodosilinea sp. LEGE 06152]MBE9157397.1 transcriptional regulator [Nodosilinea sp. LEGE 06152]
MPTHKSYQSYLVQSLEDPAEAAAYLDAVLEDGDFEHILLALKHVAEARRWVVKPSGQLNDSWDTCYRLIDKGEVPGFPLIANLLNSLGLKLSVTVQGKQAA